MDLFKNEQPAKTDIKILVVDDRKDNLFSIEAILEKDEYTIIKANSGRAALKILLQEHDFSLILMDVQMPDLNGFETATIIYERDKLRNIPIIFITAHDYGEEYIFKGYKMGGVDYIYKPINPELLRVKVAVFVELYRKNKQLQQQERKLLEVNRSLQKEILERISTEEKIRLLNSQLLENNVHLKSVNEELDQFAYVASHDLQEPLRKIMVFSDKIMSKIEMDEETEKYFKKIISSSRRMQSLINDLLSFSRHSMGSSDFKKTDLNELVREAMGELEIEIEKSGAKIHIADLPVVWAIPSLMQQLFYNLIGNAIKFRKKDSSPIVNVQAEIMTPDDVSRNTTNGSKVRHYRITVSDNGIGFDEKYAEEIFMVFKRLHSYHEYEGTGVGLSICKKIIDKHKGFIIANGIVDQGSTFTVGLPEHQVDGEGAQSIITPVNILSSKAR
jgi:signal transduction histidine kinase